MSFVPIKIFDRNHDFQVLSFIFPLEGNHSAPISKLTTDSLAHICNVVLDFHASCIFQVLLASSWVSKSQSLFDMSLLYLCKSLILPFGKVCFSNTMSSEKTVSSATWEAGLSNNKISSYKVDDPKAASEAGKKWECFGQVRLGSSEKEESSKSKEN